LSEIDGRARVIVIHGDDEVGMHTRIRELIDSLGDPSIAEMNVSRLDGRTMADDEWWNAALAMPFLAPQRIVIVTDPLMRLKEDAARARFLTRLTKLPETSRIVLVIPDEPGRKGGWEVLRTNHWLVNWIHKSEGLGILVGCPQPSGGAMTAWIRKKAEEMGGRFSAAAAAELTSHVDNNTRLAEMEVGKLLDYVNYARQVEQDDVQRLVTYTGEVDIFEMIDAMAEGNAGQAIRLLNRLLEKEEPAKVFAMIVRQFRLLLAAREIREEGGRAQQILKEMGGEPFQVNYPFVAEKLYNQAGRYTLLRLEEIYRHLGEVEQDLKFKPDGRTVLTVFIAGLASTRR
jgi:DNA polymerase III subunit delta